MTLTHREYFKIFDVAFSTQEAAEAELEGWEHKESMQTIFVLVDADSEPETTIPLLDVGYPYYHLEEHAIAHILEEQDDLPYII